MNKFQTSSCKQNTSNIVYHFIPMALRNPAVNSFSFYLNHTRSLEETKHKRKKKTKSAVKEVNSNLLRMNNFWWKCGALARQLEITAWPYDTSQEWQFDLYKGHVFRELARGSNAILEPRAIAKAPEGEGCPRCGGYVYAAEQMLARGRVSFHRIGHPIHFRDICAIPWYRDSSKPLSSSTKNLQKVYVPKYFSHRKKYSSFEVESNLLKLLTVSNAAKSLRLFSGCSTWVVQMFCYKLSKRWSSSFFAKSIDKTKW